jgi:hypothetical protein
MKLENMKKSDLIAHIRQMESDHATTLSQARVAYRNLQEIACEDRDALAARCDLNYRVVLKLAVIILKMANKAMVASKSDEAKKLAAEIADYGYKQLRLNHLFGDAKKIVDEAKEQAAKPTSIETETV